MPQLFVPFSVDAMSLFWLVEKNGDELMAALDLVYGSGMWRFV